MAKYKLNKEDKKLSKEELDKMKDFKQLSHRFESLTKRPKPLYKDRRFFLALVLIALLAYLLSKAI